MTGFWGEFPFEDRATGRWLVGPLELWVSHRPQEWRLAIRHDDEADVDRERVELPAGAFAPAADARIERYATDPEDRALRVQARLPDRPVVVRPDPPVHLLPGHEVSIHVGIPLLLALANARGTPLTEVPAVVMPETWFGPNTREGELCWAVRSKARLTMLEMPRRPGRATAVITVRNDGADTLPIERLKVPVGHLALFVAEDGGVWTQALRVVRAAGEDEARVQATAGAPPMAGAVRPLAPARRPGSASVLIRALGALLE